MYCPKCGTKCEDTFLYCYQCGFRLPVISEIQPVPTEEVIEEPAEDVVVPVEEAVAADTAVEEIEEPIEEIIVSPPVETPVPVETPPAKPIPAPPAPKKGRLWPPALVLGIMMALGLALYFLFPINPTDSKDPTVGTPWFSVIDGELFFDADLYDGGSELVIPETIDGQTVTTISKDCFSGCAGLTSIVLPDTLKEIDDRAFSFCADLRGISIPHGVIRIGNSAFSGCSSLEAIHLPSSVEIIADRALFRCPKLVHIFYDGNHEDWEKLYTGSMPNNTWVYCEDGNFPYTRN
jgi:hypothetical protein